MRAVQYFVHVLRVFRMTYNITVLAVQYFARFLPVEAGRRLQYECRIAVSPDRKKEINGKSARLDD